MVRSIDGAVEGVGRMVMLGQGGTVSVETTVKRDTHQVTPFFLVGWPDDSVALPAITFEALRSLLVLRGESTARLAARITSAPPSAPASVAGAVVVAVGATTW